MSQQPHHPAHLGHSAQVSSAHPASQTALLRAGPSLDLRSAGVSGSFFCPSAPADCSRHFHTSFKQSYSFADPGLLFTDELDAVHRSLKYCLLLLMLSIHFLWRSDS